MNDGEEKTTAVESSSEDLFVVNMTYLREQASEAVSLFFMPVFCVIRALAGGKRQDGAEPDPE